ncbi:hypothetical protein, partial [Cereibacter changlensis]|uniref:hypothetical protein n=1 Tax=Cereibacter changlensis TaxID=402884 RepID=UPI001B80DBE8
FAVGWVSYSQVLAYLNTRKFFNLLFASLMLVGIFLSIRQCFFIDLEFVYWLTVGYTASKMTGNM